MIEKLDASQFIKLTDSRIKEYSEFLDCLLEALLQPQQDIINPLEEVLHAIAGLEDVTHWKLTKDEFIAYAQRTLNILIAYKRGLENGAYKSSKKDEIIGIIDDNCNQIHSLLSQASNPEAKTPKFIGIFPSNVARTNYIEPRHGDKKWSKYGVKLSPREKNELVGKPNTRLYLNDRDELDLSGADLTQIDTSKYRNAWEYRNYVLKSNLQSKLSETVAPSASQFGGTGIPAEAQFFRASNEDPYQTAKPVPSPTEMHYDMSGDPERVKKFHDNLMHQIQRALSSQNPVVPKQAGQYRKLATKSFDEIVPEALAELGNILITFRKDPEATSLIQSNIQAIKDAKITHKFSPKFFLSSDTGIPGGPGWENYAQSPAVPRTFVKEDAGGMVGTGSESVSGYSKPLGSTIRRKSFLDYLNSSESVEKHKSEKTHHPKFNTPDGLNSYKKQ